MKKYIIAITALAAGALMAGCSGALSTNGLEQNPTVTQTNLNNDTLKFAVGTANYQGTTYLNTVVTFRQPNGNSAVLLDTPTITGPAGLVVPVSYVNLTPPFTHASGAGTDGGTNHISATVQTVPTNPGTPAAATTFGQTGGAFSYGFAPFNSTTSGAAHYPGSPALYAQPFYIDPANKLAFYGGPPAYPFFNDGSFPSGFLGYAQGFTMFGATPVGGAYSLSVLVPAANATPVTATASSTLNPAIVVGTPTIAGIVEDGTGGLSGLSLIHI